MWFNQRRTFQDHVKFIHNDIVKPFGIGIIQYTERFWDMQDISKYLPPHSNKGGYFEQTDWDIRDKYFNEDVIHIATKDWIPTSI